MSDTAPVFKIVLMGELDMARAGELDGLLAQYGASQATHVEVDLAQVTFIDSTGLGFLVGLRRLAEPRGGTVTLVGPSRTCQRLLDLVAVPTLFEIRAGTPAPAG